MSKVIDAKNWSLTPAPDGRRYSKYPDGVIDTFTVFAYTPGDDSSIAYQIYDPVAETWGSWILGREAASFGGTGGTVTTVSGTPLAGPFTFTDQTDVALDTLIESNAITVSVEGHQVKIRRQSWTTNDTSSVSYAVIAGVDSSPWTITTVAAGGGGPTIPPGDRTGIFAGSLCDEYTSDLFNPAFQETPSSRYWDNWEWLHCCDGRPGSFRGDPAIMALPHAEVRAGDHVLEGTRALLFTVYPKNHDPEVPYSTLTYSARPRSQVRGRDGWGGYIWQNNNPLTSSPWIAKGYREEFWLGFAVWLHPSFKGDFTAGGNTNFGGLQANDAPLTNFYIQHPQGKGAIWESHLKTGTLGQNVSLGQWAFNQATDVGTFHYFVYNFNLDDRSAGNGFFRLWHNKHGDSPVLRHSYDGPCGCWGQRNESDTYTGSVNMGWKPNYQLYKSGLHDDTYNGTYGPDDLVIYGFDSFRFGDSSSDFASVHPLKQAQPA